MPGVEKIIETLTNGYLEDPSEVQVVGHRVVHGGAATDAEVIDDKCYNRIEEVSPLAPLHNPQNLKGIAVAKKYFDCKHVAVFDTAFHSTIPPPAHLYGVPIDYYKSSKVRRYGFHGSSYQYILEQLEDYLEKPKDKINAVIMHLGSGASMACIKNGECIDTSMGYSPLDGLLMSTRSGDIDPTIMEVISQREGLTDVGDLINFLNKKCGLEGLCGNKDFREISAKAAAGDADCDNAQKVFVHRVRKYLGSYLLQLNNRVDAIVFTAGVGENSPVVREMVCDKLDGLGLVVDAEANSAKNDGNVREIQAMDSNYKILVFPTNEEYSIAKQSLEAAKVNVKQKGESLSGSYLGSQKVYQDTEGLFVQPFDQADTSLVEIGLLHRFSQLYESVGYFRPLLKCDPSTGESIDRRTKLMEKIFKIDDHGLAKEFSYGMTETEARQLMVENKYDEIVDRVMDKYETYKKYYDMVLVSGLSSKSSITELNLKISEALNIPNIPTITCIHGDPREVAISKAFEAVTYMQNHVKADTNAQINGVIINRMPMKHDNCSTKNTDKVKEADSELKTKLEAKGLSCITILPTSETIAKVHLDEVVEQLYAARVLSESGIKLGQIPVDNVMIASGNLSILLEEIAQTKNPIIIIDSSRVELVLSLLQVCANDLAVKVSAIVLANGHRMNQISFKRWTGQLKNSPVPIQI